MNTLYFSKRILLFFLAVFLFGCAGCWAPVSSPPPTAPSSSPTVVPVSPAPSSTPEAILLPASSPPPSLSISVQESTVSGNSEKITLLIKNDSDMEYLYGHDQILEVQSNGTWKAVPIQEGFGWDDIGISLPPGATQEETFVLQSFYGPLPAGTYRATKSFFLSDSSTQYQASVAFSIQ